MPRRAPPAGWEAAHPPGPDPAAPAPVQPTPPAAPGPPAPPAPPESSTAAQIARVETLLEAVRDMVSSLASMNRQLGREIITVLHQQTDTAHAPTDERLDALQKENAQLKEALEGRALIERAKGMLMITQHCDEQTAFQALVTLSRQQRRKVRDIAADITASPPRWQPPTPRPTP